jgi:hypothetical protein
MVRFLVVAGLVFAGFIPATEACSLAEFDPSDKNWTVEQIINGLPEVVLEGEIIQRDPLGVPTEAPKRAKLRVEYAWKGEAESVATLEFREASSACMVPPPDVGTHVRITVDPRAPNVFFYYVTSTWLLEGPKMEQALREYKRRTDATKARAEAGGHTERLAFADYLYRNREVQRAIWTYESYLRQDPDDIESLFALANIQRETDQLDDAMVTLARVRALAGRSDDWRGKVARFEFEATGWLTAKWKDWSGAKSTKPCRILGGDFAGANFDGAVLDGCSFPPQATFRGASFKSADLGGVSFALDNDFRDAKYDCATQFRSDIDPIKAGMINVEGSCPSQ